MQTFNSLTELSTHIRSSFCVVLVLVQRTLTSIHSSLPILFYPISDWFMAVLLI